MTPRETYDQMVHTFNDMDGNPEKVHTMRPNGVTKLSSLVHQVNKNSEAIQALDLPKTLDLLLFMATCHMFIQSRRALEAKAKADKKAEKKKARQK